VTVRFIKNIGFIFIIITMRLQNVSYLIKQFWFNMHWYN